MRFALRVGRLGALGVSVFALTRSAADLQAAVPPGGVAEHPIIAALVVDRHAYLGHHVEVYGLVVSVDQGGKRFFLQDVSQIPLMVVAPKGVSAAEGDQLIVDGVSQYVEGRLAIVASTIRPSRVLAGGGCC